MVCFSSGEFPTHQQKTDDEGSLQHCCAPNCKNNDQTPHVQLHPVPKVYGNFGSVLRGRLQRQRTQWIANLCITDDLVQPSDLMVCSAHFLSGKPSEDELSPDFAPTQNLFILPEMTTTTEDARPVDVKEEPQDVDEGTQCQVSF